MFVGLGLSGVVPICHLMATESSYQKLNATMGLDWVILQGALYIFGAFLYAVRHTQPLFQGSPLLTENSRFGGQNGVPLEPLTSGEALTNSSTFASFLPPPHIYPAWPRHSTTTTASEPSADSDKDECREGYVAAPC